MYFGWESVGLLGRCQELSRSPAQARSCGASDKEDLSANPAAPGALAGFCHPGPPGDCGLAGVDMEAPRGMLSPRATAGGRLRARPYRRSWQLPIACPPRSTY